MCFTEHDYIHMNVFIKGISNSQVLGYFQTQLESNDYLEGEGDWSGPFSQLVLESPLDNLKGFQKWFHVQKT